MWKFLKLQYYCRGFQDHAHQFWHNSDELFEMLKAKEWKNKVLLLMSSGNYGGLDFEELKELI